MRTLTLTIGMAFALSSIGLAQVGDVSPRVASIIGQVQYDDGRPVAGARVIAENQSGSTGRLPLTESKADGTFEIRVWSDGTYQVYASKETEMYPDGSAALYGMGGSDVPEVTVTRDGPVDAGVVMLAPKAARLAGCIVDAATGQRVRNASVTLRAVDDPNTFLMTSGGAEAKPGCFALLVPARATQFEVSAEGYETWYYGSDGRPESAGALHLQSGETLRLTVRLTANQATP